MSDPLKDAFARLDALYADQPVGQTIQAYARGRTALGEFSIAIEQTLPVNAEAHVDGAYEQMELAFHAAFGARAQHLDLGTGEPTEDLRAAIKVDVTGSNDPEAVAAAEAAQERIFTIAREAAKENIEQALIDKFVTGDDDVTLN